MSDVFVSYNVTQSQSFVTDKDPPGPDISVIVCLSYVLDVFARQTTSAHCITCALMVHTYVTQWSIPSRTTHAECPTPLYISTLTWKQSQMSMVQRSPWSVLELDRDLLVPSYWLQWIGAHNKCQYVCVCNLRNKAAVQLTYLTIAHAQLMKPMKSSAFPFHHYPI